MDHQIEVAGAEEKASRLPERVSSDRRYGPVIAGLLGLVVGSVATLALSQLPVTEPPAPNPNQVIAEPDPVAPVRTTTPPVDQPTLAELIPGLISDLVAFGTDSSGFPFVQRWDLSESSPATTTERLQSGSADLSMTYLASMEDQRYGDGFDLVVGTPNFVETIAIDAGSFAWSTTTPREIAWTERTETGFVIKSRHVPQRIDASVTFEMSVPDDVFIAWFRDDTVTVQNNQGLLTTFGRDGEVLASLDFNARADGFSGFAAANDIAGVAMIDDVPHVMSTNLEVLAAIPTSTSPCFASGFAPSTDPVARRLALLCFGAQRDPVIDVVDIGIESNSAVTVSAPATFPIDQPALPVWLGSDRFVGVTDPAPAGRPRTDLVVFDLLTGDRHILSWPGSVFLVIAFSAG